MEAEDSVNYTPSWQPSWLKLLQPAVFSILLIAGVYFGSKIGKPLPVNIAIATFSDQDIIPYLNEMDTEPIEAFLME